MIKIEIDNYS